MTTLADVNKTLQDQGKTLLEQRADIGFVSFAMNEQLRLLRQEAAERKAMQYDLLGEQRKQQATPSRVIGQRGPSDADLEDEVRKGSFLGNLLGAGLIPAMTGFLGGLGSKILGKALKGLGGFALASLFLPEIKKLSQSLSNSLLNGLETYFDFELSDENKKDLQSNFASSIKTGLISGLILGPKIGFFSAVLKFLFNSLFTNVDENGERELKPIIEDILGKDMTNILKKAFESEIVTIAVLALATALVPKVIAAVIAAAAAAPFAAAVLAIGAIGFAIVSNPEVDEKLDQMAKDAYNGVMESLGIIGDKFKLGFATMKEDLNEAFDFVKGVFAPLIDTANRVKNFIFAQIENALDKLNNIIFGKATNTEEIYNEIAKAQLIEDPLERASALRVLNRKALKNYEERLYSFTDPKSSDAVALEAFGLSTPMSGQQLAAMREANDRTLYRPGTGNGTVVSNSGNVATVNEGSKTSFFPTGNTAMDDVRLKHELATY